MELSHYSNTVVTNVRDKKQDHGINSKPNGFWVSVDGEQDWKEWCEAEGFGIGSIRHSVKLSPIANILRLASVSDIDCFTFEYGKSGPQGYGRTLIHWPLVSRVYDGIIIAPYIWERRLDGDASGWYYSWDCASGCIWNGKAIASITAELETA